MGKVYQSSQLSGQRYQIDVPQPQRELSRLGEGAGHNVTYDIEELLKASHRIVDESSNDARALINDARERAKLIVAKALEMASELENKGYEDGVQRAKEEQSEALREVAIEAREQMKHVVEQVRDHRQEFYAGAEQDLLKLSLEIAKKIVGNAIDQVPELVIGVARNALKRLSERDQVTIRVSPQDLDVLRSHRDEFLHENDLSDLRIVADPRVDRGGVMVETDGGSIDGRLDAQLQVARDAIMNSLGDRETLS